MKLTLSQVSPTDGDIEGAFNHVAMLFSVARAVRADMILLPELFLPGYNRPDLHRTKAQTLDGPWMSEMRAMAHRAGCAITFGWAERDADAIYNAATMIGPSGDILSHYRKIQLFGDMERAVFTPGSSYAPIVSFGGKQVAMLICYDIEFTGHAQALAKQGADLILVPTANPAGYDHVQTLIVPARACENAITVAYANYCGAEAGLTFGGGSVIAGPQAMVLGAAGAKDAAILIVDLPESPRKGSVALSAPIKDFRPTTG